MESYLLVESPIGPYLVAAGAKGITAIEHVQTETGDTRKAQMRALEQKETPLLLEAARQLEEYFRGERREFDLPLEEKGTPFQLLVWQALRDVPYGETRTYKEIAAALGNPKASRAVGMANNRNPISIVTPCHRVIGANGTLVGYGGGLEVKEYLLNLESMNRWGQKEAIAELEWNR